MDNGFGLLSSGNFRISPGAGGFVEFVPTSSGTGLRITDTTYSTVKAQFTDVGAFFTSGNVGIGTSTPTQKLTVSGGNIAIDGGFGFISSGNFRISPGSGGYVDFVPTTAGTGLRLTDTTYSTVKAQITETGSWFSGNVGIGTSSPTSALTVAGAIETSGGVKFPDGSLQSTALPNACATNQIPKWTGSAWGCAADLAGSGVSSITAGTGLTGGTITSSGTIAVDSTQVPLLASSNNFAASQSITGDLNIVGSGHGISFPDGTSQTTAAGGGGVLSFTLTMPGGTSIASGSCITQGITATGATTSMVAVLSPTGNPASNGLNEVLWNAFVDSANHVTAQFCHFSRSTASATNAQTFNVRVIK